MRTFFHKNTQTISLTTSSSSMPNLKHKSSNSFSTLPDLKSSGAEIQKTNKRSQRKKELSQFCRADKDPDYLDYRLSV